MLDLRSPFGFRSLPHMLSPVVPRSSNRAPGLPPYPAAALEPKADPAQDIGDKSLVVVAEPDRLDADSVLRAHCEEWPIGSITYGGDPYGAEKLRRARLEMWQRQR